jgi:ribosomal protein L11 methyltransferase
MIELRTEIPPALVESLEECLNEMVRCPWGLTQPLLTGPYQLFGYFEKASAAHAAWKKLRAVLPQLPAHPAESTLADRDWKEAYKKHLHPWTAGDLHWVPVWRKNSYKLPHGHHRLLFDAGLAFGTGDHPTTRLMALRLLDFRSTLGQTDFAKVQIVDAGCGSGILALSAVLLGARRVFAFDRDPEAVRVSQENLRLNRLDPGAVAFSLEGLEAALKNRTADLLLANIQADVLGIHADDLARVITPGGTLALSGILASEVNDVRRKFVPVLKVLWRLMIPRDLNHFGDSRVLGDWCDLAFHRPALCTAAPPKSKIRKKK